jgi:DNA modification methylase
VTWRIVQADARHLPLADATVDLILTSPPYFALRSYRDGGQHIDGQVGAEPSPQAYVDSLVGMIDSEWRRVLKPAGSLFLVLGDKYGSRGWGGSDLLPGGFREGSGSTPRAGYSPSNYKSLLGLPWRIALPLIDRGWILRADIVWSKPNGLPESVRDRVRRSHENIFHLTLRPDYYSAVDEIREPHVSSPGREGRGALGGQKEMRPVGPNSGAYSPLGRLPGSVWTIPSTPLIIPDTVKQHYALPDHFAAYPAELCRRIILGWSPREVCSVCGEGRQPVVERKPMRWTPSGRQNTTELRGPRPTSGRMDEAPSATIVGYACACATPNAPSTPGFVVDPFAGTGTTVGVAHRLGRDALGVDLSADYCRLARWRVGESGDFDQAADRMWADRQGMMM